MGFTRKVQYYLVHTHKFSNKEAKKLIETGAVKLNGTVILANTILEENDQVTLEEKEIKPKSTYVYIKYHKPVGLVSSLNERIEHSLFATFKHLLPLYIAGRLDKNSEGLMLLSNDGKWVKQLTDPESNKEKVYEVNLNKTMDEQFLNKMRNGVDIGFYLTKPCKCRYISESAFEITLTEGKNKQIRRMCKTFGYQVIKLKRTRVDAVLLNNLALNSYEMLNF
jgi:23S rRNA pseudouridine2604 synthase